jgi:hypothetical protein
MERVRAEGLTSVASLLRKMADEIEAGAVTFADRVVRCSPDLTAIVDLPVNDGEVLVVTLRLSATSDLRRPLAVEEELAHPGG